MLQSQLNIGRLDRRIVIQELTSTADEYNQPIPTWATLATVWASVKDTSGGEGYQADQLTATRNTVFTIRFRSDVRETMRILYNYRYYNIRAIKYPDRSRSMELTAELLDDPEEVAAGEGIFDLTFDASFE